ncbi:MAG: dual specificity protein phosphatase family protein [Magnetococcales bacterium]|nr:dual specificity protein phosphatase family protein [Magnetococcales bacterium]MBF0156184.1 dual specificity protein phosphatase family protein [Magnetococcales bacterium]
MRSDIDIAAWLKFSLVIPGRLAGMSMPGFNNPVDEEIDFLRKQGVVSMVNLSGNDYRSPLYRATFRVIDIPIVEYEPPSVKQMDQLIDMHLSLPMGQVMAVHCRGGIGRTGTVLACMLGKIEGLSGDEAIRMVRNTRLGSVESGPQLEFVKKYLGS